MGKRGVLLINVGTPDQPSIESVRNYLKNHQTPPPCYSVSITDYE